MTLQRLYEIFQNVGAIAGICVSIAGFLTLVLKAPKEKIGRLIRAQAEAANEQIREDLRNLQRSSEERDKVDLALLRHNITRIYFTYKEKKEIPHFEKENVLSLFEQYEKLGGNSYIKSIVVEMKSWEELQ